MRRIGVLISVLTVAAIGVCGAVAVPEVSHPAIKQVMPASQRADITATGKTAADYASSAAQVDTSTQCPEVLFMGARGTGEYGPGSDHWPRGRSSSDYYGLGGDVNEVYMHLENQLGSDLGSPVSVPYPADRVQTLLRADFPKYFGDLSSGVSWTLSYLENQVKNCPDQQIVLAGFSQGAMVMHRVLHQLPTPILSRVTAAILIGDGDQVPFDNATKYGSASSAATGIGQDQPEFSGSSLTRFSTNMDTQVLRVCNLGDIVCDNLIASAGGSLGLAHGVLVHLAYEGSKPLQQAEDQAANDLLAFRYTGPALALSGTVGTRLSVTATMTGGVLTSASFGSN